MAADLLAPALGIAASPFGIIPAILLLFTPTPRASAAAFLGGWLVGVLAGFLLAVAASDLLAGREPGPWVDWLRVIAGAALLVLGVRQWLQQGAAAEMPGWMESIADSRPGGAARLGLLLSLANPKVLLLAVAGGLAAAGALSGQAMLLPGLAFAAVASVSIAVPLLLYLAAGERVLGPLGKARDWLVRHNGAIVAVVLLLIGLLLLAKGLAAVSPWA